MEFNLADLFEAVVATVPGNEALVCRGTGGDPVRWTYADLGARTNQMARLLQEAGVGPGDRVGLDLHNGWPYVVGMMAAFALRAVPVNLNYRYTAHELAHVLRDAEPTVVLCEPALRPVVDEARAAVADGRDPVVLLADAALAPELDRRSADPVEVGPRSADDLYLLYTGGTTGMPKGVMWRHEDIYFASLGGRGTPSKGIPALTRPEQVVDRARKGDPIMRRLPLCPMMHGGAMWISLQTHLYGGALVLSTDRHFDADGALALMAAERVEMVMLIGDATARPLAAALASAPDAHDLRALQVIASGGAILSADTADSLRRSLPAVKVVDTFGASETGGQGRLRRDPAGGPPRLLTDADTAVFDDAGIPIPPGTGAIGRLGRSGHIPLGYWRDAEKTAATFPELGGRRWSVPGDLARVEDDGSITLLGRSAVCINTGGEKVFVEEVEDAIKRHPAVADALVVGLPDERFGQQVAAVVSLRPDAGIPSDAELAATARDHLAGYKVPRRWVRVEACRRLPTGKPDYAWARLVAGGGDAVNSG